jgi:hypothetical protein
MIGILYRHKSTYFFEGHMIGIFYRHKPTYFVVSYLGIEGVSDNPRVEFSAPV